VVLRQEGRRTKWVKLAPWRRYGRGVSLTCIESLNIATKIQKSPWE
jgi:hypothetical protein